MSKWADSIASQIIGAKIVAVEEAEDDVFVVRLHFEVRGTDDGDGWIDVVSTQIHFASEEEPRP